MKWKNKRFNISYCICPDCDKYMTVPRTRSQREKNHIKNLFCPFCKEEKQMTEIRHMDFYKNALGELLIEKEEAVC